jgi:putative ABC transport system ATP-binding protein
MPHLELKDVSKAVWRNINGTMVRSSQILFNVNLVVQRGDLVTVKGPCGSGKTTIIKLINGLLEADSGDILLNGIDIKEYQPVELRQKVGMVLQVPVVFQGSVRDNLSLDMELWGEDIDLECIARALANRPEILLLDEPTSYLDMESARKIEELLLNLCKEKDLTLFWVTTHGLEQAKRIGGRRFVLNKGKLEKEYN